MYFLQSKNANGKPVYLYVVGEKLGGETPTSTRVLRMVEGEKILKLRFEDGHFNHDREVGTVEKITGGFYFHYHDEAFKQEINYQANGQSSLDGGKWFVHSRSKSVFKYEVPDRFYRSAFTPIDFHPECDISCEINDDLSSPTIHVPDLGLVQLGRFGLLFNFAPQKIPAHAPEESMGVKRARHK